MNTMTDKHKTFTAGTALVANRRVKILGAGLVGYAGDGEACIGITTTNAASGAAVTVKLINDSGTFAMTAKEAITANKAVYGAADGKITGTAAGDILGMTNEASTADGDVIEIVRIA